MNSVNLSGRLIRDPEIKTFENGSTLCSFFIANDIHFGTNKKTGFYKCQAWGHVGKVIAENAKTGAELFLTGRLDQYRYEDENKKQVYDVSIVVDRFDFGARSAKVAEAGPEEKAG